MSKDKSAKRMNVGEFIEDLEKKKPLNLSPTHDIDENGIAIPLNVHVNDGALIRQEQDLIEYNKKVLDLDTTYTSLIPISDIIVRVFAKELERTKSGIILPASAPVVIPTNSGHGNLGTVESPYSYSKKAVVIAVPAGYKGLDAGDIVQLSDATVTGHAIGAGHEATISIRHSFTHYDHNSEQPPTNPKNPHYGYLMVPVRFIDCVVKKA
jgi:hypothetical protein